MSYFKEQLLSVLDEIKGSGSFVTTDSKPFVFPGLEVRGVGEIGFPVNPLQIREMIKTAHKAPFGKGSETVLDTAVRSAWEIDAGEITFSNSDWDKFIAGIVKSIKPGLGIEGHHVSANLYKLLIYESGDFFLTHKDSEKEKGMFGTLIVGLPAKHTGGELIVKFDGKTETIDFSGPSNQYKIPFAAFYADCEHEIQPITSGYRVCLIYNLIQDKGKEKIELHQLGGFTERLSTILKAGEDEADIPKIVLLGHQYTPSNFTMESLKLNDRPKAEALILAARKAGFYAKLGLVTSYQAGQLEMDYSKGSSRSRGRGRYYDDFDDYDDDELSENGTMGEVYDERIDVEHWMQEGVPPLRNIHFEEEDLISSIKLNEGDPVAKEAEGYTGNAGMEMYYWYHYGAVFLWPKKYQYEILTDLSSDNKLEWIAWYNKHWDAVETDEKALIKRLAEESIEGNNLRDHSDYSPLADWLINLNDEIYLEEKGINFLTNCFRFIAVESWIKLFKAYSSDSFEKIFTAVGGKGYPSAASHLLDVLNALLAEPGNYRPFIVGQTDHIPAYLNALSLSGKDEHNVAKDILRNVFKLSNLKTGDDTWLKNTTVAFTRVLNRGYVNDVLVKTILESGKGLAIAGRIMEICKNDLNERVDNKPQPPVDWSRPLPKASSYYSKVWVILADFIQSPTQQIFDYQRVQGERSEMENAIRNVTIDLKTETIKKGSPHTLRLIKTQDAYQRELTKWEADVALLKKASDF
ncbi:hypothetical protein [Mucilaginibacter sp.]|uniref:hypothetical protein n=1 Tax=Mucilaginibacter sp. TaxID=1882438 RepID=UPI00283EE504|nr:hypothetical protein [Mucilaginibacter sp.]MDR3695316.1 hypothetical protein [Mucilaginibacter sp.]